MGSLVVNATDLQELSEAAASKQTTDDNKDKKGGSSSSHLMDRIADDVHTTTDDFNPWANRK